MHQVSLCKTFLKSAVELGLQDKAKIVDFLNKILSDYHLGGLNLEKLKSARELYSARVDQNLRAIFHQKANRRTLLYVDSHQGAYEWAERQRFILDPNTGHLHVIPDPEVLQQQGKLPALGPEKEGPLFQKHPDEYLLSLGLPPDWLTRIRFVTSEDQLYELSIQVEELDSVWERLIRVAKGEIVPPLRDWNGGPGTTFSKPELPALNPPDKGENEQPSLWEEDSETPFDEWRRFLHPRQKELVVASFPGVSKVTGTAGTGKTLVGIHRAARLANEGHRVFLTTYTTTLSHYLRNQLKPLLTDTGRGQVIVENLHSWAGQILAGKTIDCQVVPPETSETIIARMAEKISSPFPIAFLVAEWKEVIAAQGLESLDEYLKSDRDGRGSALQPSQRSSVWEVLGPAMEEISQLGIPSYSLRCRRVREMLESTEPEPLFDAVIADEIQDFNPQEIRLLARLGSTASQGMMLLGDTGQRIYAGGYSLRALGIRIPRGQSRTLKIAYRTGEMIRRFAEKILDNSRDDLEGQSENAADSFSIRKGNPPVVKGFADNHPQDTFVVAEIQRMLQRGYDPGEIGVIARTRRTLDRILGQLCTAGIPAEKMDTLKEKPYSDAVTLITMHSAKGLEFRAVFILNCQQGHMPLQAAIRDMNAEDQTMAEIRERHLLYVSVTRAREDLMVLWVGEPSKFLPR